MTARRRRLLTRAQRLGRAFVLLGSVCLLFGSPVAALLGVPGWAWIPAAILGALGIRHLRTHFPEWAEHRGVIVVVDDAGVATETLFSRWSVNWTDLVRVTIRTVNDIDGDTGWFYGLHSADGTSGRVHHAAAFHHGLGPRLECLPGFDRTAFQEVVLGPPGREVELWRRDPMKGAAVKSP